MTWMGTLLGQIPTGFGGLLMLFAFWWPVLLAFAAFAGLVAYFHRRRNRSRDDTNLNL